MDERVFRVKVGLPVPNWGLWHHLGINSAVGPECKDSATISHKLYLYGCQRATSYVKTVGCGWNINCDVIF